MDVEEVEFVDECPQCDLTPVGMTPEEMREHMTAEHSPLCALIVFPTPEERRRHARRVSA